MKTILTGIRVGGELTLGNFLGALLPMVRLANAYSHDHHINIFVPDLHSIITEIDGNLQQNLVRSLKYYLAAGLTVNQNVHLYRQSRIPAHSELCWILDCFTQIGEARRMTQYKDKGEGRDSANVGIFNYPILMAADILLYDATFVPVGEDQFQHLELTRSIATRFNHRFGREVFTVPATPLEQAKFMGQEEGIRIRDLLNPEKKMSKSTPGENSKIMLSDAPAKAAKKIMSATTDSVGKISFDMFNQPGISNLLQIDALLTATPLQDVIGLWAGKTAYGELKSAVATHVADFLTDFQAKVAAIPDEDIYHLLESGEAYAAGVATAKLTEVQTLLHLR